LKKGLNKKTWFFRVYTWFLLRAAHTDSVSLRDAKMEYLLATRGAKASKKLKDFWF
jgi:hypothetical protein